MRILMGVHALPPFSTGGTENAALVLAEGLAERGARIVLFHPIPESTGLHGLVRRSNAGRLTVIGRPLSAPADLEESYLHPEAPSFFLELLESFQPDIIHIHHLTGLSMAIPGLARERNVPVVLTLHDYWMMCARGQLTDLEWHICPGPTSIGCATCLADQLQLRRSGLQFIGKLLRRMPHPPRGVEVLKRGLDHVRSRHRPPTRDRERMNARLRQARSVLETAAGWIAPSGDILERYESADIRPQRTWRIPHPSPPRIRRDPPRPGGKRFPPSTGDPPPRPLRLLFVGAVIPTKGLHILLDALDGFPSGQLTLSVVGPSPRFHRAPLYSEKMRARARGIGVRWLGVLPQEALFALYRAHHLLVVPSIWPENAPMVIEEALSAGLPVVASRVGGIPEFVHDGETGTLVAPGDPSALRRALRRYLESPERLRRQIRNASLRTRPTLDDFIAAHRRVYAEITGKR